jgi:hypothetical protein
MGDSQLVIGSPLIPTGTAEERMVKEDVVREILARLARGDGVSRSLETWASIRRR